MKDYKYIVIDGDLTIKGKNADGQEVILEAPIKDTKIIVDQDVERIEYWDKINVLSRSVTFAARLKDGGVYTVSIPKALTGVERTARVLGWEDPEGAVRREPTIKLIKEAAKKAGVSEDTDFALENEYDFTRQMNKVYIVFKWVD